MASLHGYPELAEDAAKGRGPEAQRFYRRLVTGILFLYLQGICTWCLIQIKVVKTQPGADYYSVTSVIFVSFVLHALSSAAAIEHARIRL
jgi:hypothetical protein